MERAAKINFFFSFIRVPRFGSRKNLIDIKFIGKKML